MNKFLKEKLRKYPWLSIEISFLNMKLSKIRYLITREHSQFKFENSFYMQYDPNFTIFKMYTTYTGEKRLEGILSDFLKELLVLFR
jgi:hypothetical protein